MSCCFEEVSAFGAPEAIKQGTEHHSPRLSVDRRSAPPAQPIGRHIILIVFIAHRLAGLDELLDVVSGEVAQPLRAILNLVESAPSHLFCMIYGPIGPKIPSCAASAIAWVRFLQPNLRTTLCK